MRSFGIKLDASYMTSKPDSQPFWVLSILIFYSDDPFNLTAADNSEWLRRFKRHFDISDEQNINS